MKRKMRGQSSVETVLLFVCVVGAMIFLIAYLQRGAQGMVKGNADSLGSQFSAVNAFTSKSVQNSYSAPNGTGYQSESVSCSDARQGIGGAAPGAVNCTPGALSFGNVAP